MKVSDDVEARLIRISEFYGLPPSTLAAFAVGQWLTQQERALQLSEVMINKMAGTMGEAFTKELQQQIGLFTKGPETET